MNHLAHCFLSFDNEDLLLGNFMGDFVKGNDWLEYPVPVQQGILLHRTIDSYTDSHPITNRSVARIRPFAGRYGRPFTDILYDYLLAVNWEKYTDTPFEVFVERTYGQLEKRATEMPAILQERLPRMIAGRFLHGYTSREGLEWVLDRFSLRLVGQFDARALGEFFFQEIDAFSADFALFFPDLLAAAKAKITPLTDHL